MTRPALVSNERGVALILTLMLAIIVASMSIGIIMMMSNANLISRYHAKEAMMEAAADAGLEQGRDTLNGAAIFLPITGFDTLELNASVRDASGTVIPGFTRSVYAGRSGITTGQFGVFASVISIINDPRGSVVVRRSQLSQESFAKFAEFTDTFPPGLCVGYGNVKFGPVHSNTNYVLCGTGPAVFNGKLTVVGSITNQGVGTYNQGFQTGVARINMPTPVQLASVQAIAATAGMVINGGAINDTMPTVRIEFFPVDVNLDGDVTDDNEGFIRVFQATPGAGVVVNQHYVNGRRWWNNNNYAGTGASTGTDANLFSPNCGGIAAAMGANWVTADSAFRTAALATIALKTAAARALLTSPQRRCYLGGDPAITRGIWMVADPHGYGSWLPYPGWAGAPPAALQAAVAATGQPGAMANYLWPINRTYSINFQGVIYVNGSVALSGRVRGSVLVAATGNVMLDDDLQYVTAPNTTCADMLGYTSPRGIIMADNSVNSPFEVNNQYVNGFDDTQAESFNGVFLALTAFTGENPSSGANSGTIASGRENCPAGTAWGRGCDVVIGGLIQRNAGATGSTSGAGWNDQYSYDVCSYRSPPPYFPTTGRYSKYQYYEIDPVGFSVPAWFAANQ